MKFFIVFFLVLFSSINYAQNEHQIKTSDIDNFWNAYDHLKNANSKSDSIKIIQEQYIDKASTEFIEFIRLRNFTSEEYVRKISLYPNFWETVREDTQGIKNRVKEIKDIFKLFEQYLPNFKAPKVCFAIGCLRTGGTTSSDLILIGSEIAAASHTVDKSQLSNWLKSVIGNTGDITAMIAHETIHTQQINKRKNNLLVGSMKEGIADFISHIIIGKIINEVPHNYGNANECKLKIEFSNDLKSNPKDYSKWLYNGNNSKNRPADLGYFIGFKIAEAYYNDQSDKNKALEVLLDEKKYKRIFKESNYLNKQCN